MREGFSWQPALMRLEGDTVLMASLARDFALELQSEFPIAQRLRQRDRDGAADLLHALRGSAAILGAEALAEFAGDLEAELRAGEPLVLLADRCVILGRMVEEAEEAMRGLADQMEAEEVATNPYSIPSWHSIARARGLPGRPKILIVDDRAINLRALEQIFQQDHEVLLASSAREALELSRSEKPDLILLDVVMPGMDGYEACRRLKSDEELREIPVIFVTSQNSTADETRGLEIGAADFISKPFSPAVVRARVRTHLVVKAQADLLRSLAFSDGLTGVANRRRFEDQLDIEWRACQRGGSELSVLMIDIDHFKQYNDHYGHQMGDQCLRNVAVALQAEFRRARDFFARYGGEEFSCLLPETHRAGAAVKAHTLQRAIGKLGIPHGTSPTAGIVTLSIGVATTVPGPEATARELVAAADLQLYQAKASGRNRVAVAG